MKKSIKLDNIVYGFLTILGISFWFFSGISFCQSFTKYSRGLKKQAKEAGAVLTGFLFGKPLAELYSNAGFFVLPSYYEGL